MTDTERLVDLLTTLAERERKERPSDASLLIGLATALPGLIEAVIQLDLVKNPQPYTPGDPWRTAL